MRKTKIVCTLGPAVNRPDRIEALIAAGMNVARFNFSHGDQQSHAATYDMVDAVRQRLGAPLATLLDTRGPEVRTLLFKGGEAHLEAGQTVRLVGREVLGDAQTIPITHSTLYRDVHIGDKILLDDGLIELTVTSLDGEDILCQVENSGIIKNRKGVNIPGVDLSLPYLSDKDRDDIVLGASKGFDYVAASFVSSEQDVYQVRQLLAKCGQPHIGIIAKIESRRGVSNIDAILKAADGIMVARGDLGVEIPMAEVPVVQKMLIKRAHAAGKMVIIATQMLESMTQNPRPTRAEVADIANAVYEGATAVMLSGETAAGNHPIEAVNTMRRICERVERDLDYPRRMGDLKRTVRTPLADRPTAIAQAACATAHSLNAQAIVGISVSGYTTRMLSSFQPGIPILGCTPNPDTYRRMALYWGVQPVLIPQHETSTDALFTTTIEALLEGGYIDNGHVLVLTAGVPIGIVGTTNMLRVHVVGEPIAF
jgi:pyruvate kinase